MSTIIRARNLFSANVVKNVANYSRHTTNAKPTTQTNSFLSTFLKAFSTWSA